MRRRSWIVYGVLLSVWLLLIGWQVAEHARVRRTAREALVNRANDISNTLGLLMRSQRFFGMINQERLESALNELVAHGDLTSLLLLNAIGEVVASAGAVKEPPPQGEFVGGVHWGQNSVMLVNLMDLGTNLTHALPLTNISIVIPSSEMFNRAPHSGTNEFRESDRNGDEHRPRDMVEGVERRPPPRDGERPPEEGDHVRPPDTNGPPPGRFRPPNWRRSGWTNDPSFFVRPFWMKEEDYQSIIKKKGVHSFIIVMSTKSLQPVFSEDLLVRLIIGILGTVSVLGSGFAWRNLEKTSELQIRLVRASEQNLHLQQMNLAAAGLAHETRNPLNIVRGLAQLIMKGEQPLPDAREKAGRIIDETDRVTAQLNEFINFSRPREVHYATTKFNAVAADVARALCYDIEEKKIVVEVQSDPLYIQADEPMLRQALFNLVLNAVQSAPIGGKIQLVGRKVSNSEAVIEIQDNGHGVPPEHEGDIFKPYFTTREKGTGLGLAVVKQIVSAHHWEIQYVPNQPAGAIFRINQIKLTAARA